MKLFDNQYRKDAQTGCWIWQGALDNRGYGLARWNKKRTKAHRVSLLRLGHRIEGLFVCHHCDTPSCVNPEHLFTGTHHDNDQDRIQKGRCARGERAGSSRLTEAEVISIRASTETQVELARRYKTTAKNIRDIQKRRTWRHL
jgi:hypothetical protein